MPVPDPTAATLHDEQRTVLEVYSRTHAGLVPDAIEAVLASLDAVRELAMKGLLADAEENEGEPCWCPLWWWEEQTGPTEGEHTEHCDKQREVYVALGGVT